MNPITLATIKFKKIPTKKKLINLGLFLFLLGAILIGYFLGREFPRFRLAGILPTIEEKSEEQVSPIVSEGAKIGSSENVLPTVYEEIAQKGDGVTHLARRALKAYLIDRGKELNLTKEHKIYIEDYMQKKTGDFWLQVGQKLTFSEDLIKEAIEHALQLTPEQLQNLTQYSQLVSGLDY